ncbi:MAG TPA: hypothetical protein VGC85_07310 [Chthoniobacterales bacterium]|jgi:hypothetical protein
MKILQSRFLIFALPLITAAALITLRAHAQDRKKWDFRSELRIEFPKHDQPDDIRFDPLKSALEHHAKKIDDNTRAHDLTYEAEGQLPKKMDGGVDRSDHPTPERAIHVGQVVAFGNMQALQKFVDEVNATPTPSSKPTP